MSLTDAEGTLLKETHDSAIRTEERVEKIEEITKIHSKVIFGNAHWGLVSRVRLLWAVVVICGGYITLLILERVFAG